MSKTVIRRISNNARPKHNEHEVKGKPGKTLYGGDHFMRDCQGSIQRMYSPESLHQYKKATMNYCLKNLGKEQIKNQTSLGKEK